MAEGPDLWKLLSGMDRQSTIQKIMSDSTVKTRTMGNTIGVVGIETGGLSIKGGMRTLQRLATANHGWAQYPADKRSWMSTRAS